MKKELRKANRRSKKPPQVIRVLKWSFGIAVVALVAYLISQSAGVAYNERNIGVVDFSALKADEKHSALVAANAASCTCGCGMTLAQCVSTDSTCPIREDNIRRIRTMVQEADKP
jgi:hypothetical protein